MPRLVSLINIDFMCQIQKNCDSNIVLTLFFTQYFLLGNNINFLYFVEIQKNETYMEDKHVVIRYKFLISVSLF